MQPASTIACALRYAGARNAIISLWQSNSNQEMIDFYKARLSGASAIIALRKAQLSRIARNIHPEDWASWQIFAPMY